MVDNWNTAPSANKVAMARKLNPKWSQQPKKGATDPSAESKKSSVFMTKLPRTEIVAVLLSFLP